MWCAKCQHDLVECTCPDLKERLGKAMSGGHVAIADVVLRYRPKAKSKPAKKRARRKRKNDAARD